MTDEQIPAGPVVPTEGTGDLHHPTGGVAQLSSIDLKSMTTQQINEARRAGRLADLLAGRTR